MRQLPPVYITPLGEQVFDWPVEKAAETTHSKKPLYSGGFFMQSNGAWGVAKQYSLLNRTDLRRRIALLGLSVNQFANRAGIPNSALYVKGRVPLHVERLLQFEEFLAALADALDRPVVGKVSTLRHDVEAALMAQVKRLP